ncbi:maleate cis-trans isomerase family protein [Roseinatronobacter sp. NSM]|uniref:maleate cis-trans isomerase family protein n=1 Tax=Roseinatronobacter sp. NSM TaxID=3457785 RepID=UPI0040372F4C
MTAFPYTLLDDDLPRLGLIVLQVDETIEQEFCRLFPPHLARLHVTRVPSGAELTPDTVANMERALPGAARLLPATQPLDVVGYACTSGTTLIGADRVRGLVTGATQTKAVTDPLTAALAQCARLGLARVGIVSPYIASVAEPIRAAFETAGVAVPDMLSFGEQVEARVARIAPRSIADAARALAQRSKLHAVFLSCTNLRTLGILAPLTRELGLPVISSNQCLAAHMGALAHVAPVTAS